MPPTGRSSILTRRSALHKKNVCDKDPPRSPELRLTAVQIDAHKVPEADKPSSVADLRSALNKQRRTVEQLGRPTIRKTPGDRAALTWRKPGLAGRISAGLSDKGADQTGKPSAGAPLPTATL